MRRERGWQGQLLTHDPEWGKSKEGGNFIDPPIQQSTTWLISRDLCDQCALRKYTVFNVWLQSKKKVKNEHASGTIAGWDEAASR